LKIVKKLSPPQLHSRLPVNLGMSHTQVAQLDCNCSGTNRTNVLDGTATLAMPLFGDAK
jgi:hypothetical protein